MWKERQSSECKLTARYLALFPAEIIQGKDDAGEQRRQRTAFQINFRNKTLGNLPSSVFLLQVLPSHHRTPWSNTEDTTQHHPTWEVPWTHSNAFGGTDIFLYLLWGEVVAFCNKEITPGQVTLLCNSQKFHPRKKDGSSAIAFIPKRLVAVCRLCWSISGLLSDFFAHAEAWKETDKGI